MWVIDITYTECSGSTFWNPFGPCGGHSRKRPRTRALDGKGILPQVRPIASIHVVHSPESRHQSLASYYISLTQVADHTIVHACIMHGLHTGCIM